MERFQDTSLGLTLFGAAYALHFMLEPFARNKEVLRWVRAPLSIAAWIGTLALLLPLKDAGLSLVRFAERPSVSTILDVFVFISLALLAGLVVQHPELVRFEKVRPFFLSSLTFRHSVRRTDDIFGGSEQQDIDGLQAHGHELRERFAPERKRPRERTSPEQAADDVRRLRARRMASSGEEERGMLERGAIADLTDAFRLMFMNRAPHPRFEQVFRVVADPTSRQCVLDIVFPRLDTKRLRSAEPWFRFRQELFDIMQAFATAEWSKRFRPYFDTVVLACHVEETDAFGVPKKTAFLSASMPLSVLDAYAGRLFVATEFEKHGSVAWIEGESP